MTKKVLSKLQYQITQEGATEPPFSGKYYHHKESGDYLCICCDTPLFHSNTKFESNSGWPSFDNALPDNIEYKEDNRYGIARTEVRCANCKAHLGHLFDDGPTPTGKRYCINSAVLNFRKA